MHVDLIKLLGSILGFIISWKLVFLIFSPSELSVIIMVAILLFAAYGIQLVEWPEESSFSLFGVRISELRKIKQQYKILGLIPVSGVSTIQSHYSIFGGLDPYTVLPLAKAAISSLPFGGLVDHKISKNK